MAKQSPSLYSISKTFMWFTIVSTILTASLVGIVWLDYSREWKKYQKEFATLKLKSAQAELKTAEQGLDKKKIEGLEKDIVAAQKAFETHKAQYAGLQKQSDALVSKIAKAKARFQTEKQFEDSYRYYLEESREKKEAGHIASYEKKLNDTAPKVQKYKTELETLEKTKEGLESQLAKYLEKEKTLSKELDKALEQKTRLDKRIAKLKPSLAKDVLNAPVIDFIAPTLQVQQIVLEDLQDDYHFAKVQKVDRCVTCHLGIDQKGFESAPQPFRTHPKLDTFLGSTSPHPLEKIGCTSCHGGSGQAVSFIETAHTPNDEKQEHEWVKKYHWKEMHHWETKMLPLKHVEAGCVKCHNGVVEVPQAPKLNKGRELATEMGCLNCHKVKGFEDRWKVGPDLANVQSKLSPEWMNRWLQDPTQFRADSKMPKVFHLSNTATPEDRAKNEAAIQSIVEYLMKNSSTVTLSKPASTGDAANGEKLVKELGCLACHSAAGVDKANFGPSLTGLGSKVTPEWLYTWLKDPKHYSKNTRMPNLRLSDKEATDITSYLLADRNASFEAKPLAKAAPQVVDALIMESLQGQLRRSEAEDALKKMSSEEKLQYLGKKSISHQGCFGCHNIQGFEEAKPIGAELSDEGRKDVHKFDFGFVEIPETPRDFIHQKIKDPRGYDHGKLKAYYEKLRMPQFQFKDGDIEALTTFVLSLTEEQVPLTAQKRLSDEDKMIEKGRLLVLKQNCNGCHTLDGKTGLLREMAEDPGSAPPVLDGEGAKTQEKWLHDFLHAPTPIRPWLQARMPSFGFDESELRTLVFYFHHLSDQEMAFGDITAPSTTPEKLQAGKQLFDMFQCAKCHQVTQESAAMGTSFLAPELGITKHRLKPEWTADWLRDPQKLQEGTMMPTFFADGQSPAPDILGGDAEKQIEAIRDYLYRYETSPADSQSKEKVAK